MVSAAFYSAMAGFFLGSRLGVLSLAVATALDGVTAATLFGMSFPAGLQAGVVAAVAFQLAAFSAMTLHAGSPGPLHRYLRAKRATIRAAFGRGHPARH
jgi:hypothetical protein